jgi:acyl-CoA thioester hydrolase
MLESRASFAHRFRVRFSEVDMHGHVFNANYLAYCNMAITEFLRYHGYAPAADARIEGLNFIVVRTSVDYKGGIRFDELIDAHVRVSRVSRSSLTFEITLTGESLEDLRAVAEVVWVAVNATTRSAAQLPQPFVDKITGGGSSVAGSVN